MVEDINHIVVFSLAEQQYALRLSAVEQVVRMVAIAPLPHAPAIVLGVINMRGRIVPVFRIRERFRQPDREICLSDHLIIARTSKRSVALVVDAVRGVVTRSDAAVTLPERILPGLDYVEGVVKLKDGLVFIHDIETFLSVDEEEMLERALPA